MSSLEAYIVELYGKWIHFDICSEELGFDVEECVGLTIEKKGSVMACSHDVAWNKPRRTGYKYSVPVMSSTVVRGNHLHYTEFAKLLDLNMHYEAKEKPMKYRRKYISKKRFNELKKEGYFADHETHEKDGHNFLEEVYENGDIFVIDKRTHKDYCGH